jgi:glyoxylate/hydroxypyruvate reductase
MNVLLVGELPAQEWRRWHQALAEAMPEATFLDETSARLTPESVYAAVVANPAPGALLGFPQLALVQSLWAGVERLLADASIAAALPIARMVDPAMNAAMAETALWATLSLHRGFFAYAQRQREGQWRVHAQRRADEIQVLVLGLGEMGRTAAQRLAQQGYRVSGWRLHDRPHLGQRDGDVLAGVEVHAGKAALWATLPRAEVLINLLPLTPQTRGVLNQRLFAALPQNASIVNLARGAHLVDEDLLAALDSGHLRRAVLDVFHTEPLPAAHRFWSHPRVTVLPHAAARTDARSAAAVVARNLRALRDGLPLANRVDRQRGY